jgi:lysozyme
MDYSNARAIAVQFLEQPNIEGFSPTAYWDVNGWAIAYGNHYYLDGTAVQKGDTITREDAQPLISQVVADKDTAISPYVRSDLTDNNYAALLSLTYNWGEGNVRKSVLLQMINNNSPEPDIQDQWLKTAITAGGVENDELVTRRGLEYDLYSTSDNVNATTGGVGVFGLVILGLGVWAVSRAIK